jgi:DNA-binding response OmpR family regulator
MTARPEPTPAIALVDDDAHSARLLTRALEIAGGPSIEWLGNASLALEHLRSRLTDSNALWPSLVIVDLKTSSIANLAFIHDAADVVSASGLRIAAMVRAESLRERDALYDAGASVVFTRHFEIDAYRKEAVAIVKFWAQGQCLDAVGM